MLYREPKLLKGLPVTEHQPVEPNVSVLYREPKLVKARCANKRNFDREVSVLYREPKLLNAYCCCVSAAPQRVSVLYREPKLLKAISTINARSALMFQCSTVSRNC